MKDVIKKIAKKTLGPLHLYSSAQKKWQRAGERVTEEKIARKREQSLSQWTPPLKYREAGKYLYNYLKFSEEFLDKQAGTLILPENIRSIKIDIGLSYTAPNSALWISRNPHVFVFGFEPNTEAVNYLLYGKMNLKNNRGSFLSSLRKIGGIECEKYLGKNFILFDIAIDNCAPCMKEFYMTEGVGTSSFHRPEPACIDEQPEHFSISEHKPVPTIRLSDFMSLLPWEKFPYVEQIKIDTQGNDVRVLESAGEYLRKVVFVTAEVPADKQYEYSHTEQELDALMTANNFEFIKNTDRQGNKTYVNKSFKHLLDTPGNTLDYKTIEL